MYIRGFVRLCIAFMKSLQTRGHVLITGASSGIGRASAIELAQAGFEVFAGVRRPQDAQSIEAEAKPIGRLSAVILDVTDSSNITAAVKQISERVGEQGLAGVVNNAGISVVGPIEFVSLADFHLQFEINFFGAIAVTQATLPLLRQHVARSGPGSARLVNMSSIGGRIAQPILGPYTASKFALESLTDSLRMELLPQGIQVCSVNPGAIDTPIWSKARATADAITANHPARVLYGSLIDGVTTGAARAHASAGPVSTVAAAVLACMTAGRPKTRYFVGKDAKSGALAKRLIPDRIFDRILARYFRES
jgi:NAD(P)-dependent dehydrogenase (short-subunit alcohol dehydrogenase family)